MTDYVVIVFADHNSEEFYCAARGLQRLTLRLTTAQTCDFDVEVTLSDQLEIHLFNKSSLVPLIEHGNDQFRTFQGKKNLKNYVVTSKRLFNYITFLFLIG